MLTTSFLGKSLSRLVLGDNPFNGHSYISDLHSGSEMMDYYSEANTVATMLEAQGMGINAYIGLGDSHVLRVLRQFELQGGKMRYIFQFYPPIDLDVNIPMMKNVNPLGIYHQGSVTDYMVDNGQVGKIKENIQKIKDAGIHAGLGTHVPKTLIRAEEENWGAEFYMACLYCSAPKNGRAPQSGFITGKPKQLVFYPEDRFEMLETIRRIGKPCIAFKLFAGGQRLLGLTPEQVSSEIETVFRETYNAIKPGDIACVGVYQKYKDQLKENIDIANKVLGNG